MPILVEKKMGLCKCEEVSCEGCPLYFLDFSFAEFNCIAFKSKNRQNLNLFAILDLFDLRSFGRKGGQLLHDALKRILVDTIVRFEVES